MFAQASTQSHRRHSKVMRLSEDILALRDKLLTNRRFRSWALAFPLTRAIARRRARSLFDLCAGFVYSQILLACIRLDLFPILREGPQPIEQLSRRLGLEMEAARTLLDAAASLQLVERRSGNKYALGSLGAAVVDEPGLSAMIEHHVLLYEDLSDPVAILRGQRSTRMAAFWPYARAQHPNCLPPEAVGAYTRLMSCSQSMIADQVAQVLSLSGRSCLLDVGCGDGSFAISVAARFESMRLILFDLAAVVEIAKSRLNQTGLSERTTAVSGDFLSDPLPTGADVVSLVRVLHDHSDRDAASLLAGVFRALPPGGMVLVCEPMSDTTGAEPIGAAYFGFYLLAMGRGRPRSANENIDLLHAAGFIGCHRIPTRLPMLATLITAKKPE